MRTSASFTPEARARLRRYIARNPDVSTAELAAELYLDVKTVSAWRALNNRSVNRRFNQGLSR